MAVRLRLWQARILRACVVDSTGDSARALADSAPHGAIATLPVVASYHRVVGHVWEALASAVPPDVRAALQRLQRDELARKLMAAENLRRTRELLQELDIPFLIVKGPILSSVIYDDPSVRFYRDLDVIVPPTSFARALSAFEETGAHVIDANWPYFLEHVAGQVDLSTNVDLHWHLLFFDRLRRETRIRMEDVFERARTVTVEGVSIRTLDPADTLIHLAVHACLAGGSRLGWFKDLEQSVVNDRPAWDDVVARSQQWRVNLLVGTMLLRSRHTLGTPVGDDVLRELIPRSSWRALLRSLDAVFPITAWSRRETPAVRLAQVTQPTPAATARYVVSAAARRVLAATARRRSEETTASDERAREAYLERVAGAA